MEIPWALYGALLGSGLAMGLGAIGSGLGLGMTSTGAIRGMAIQPVTSTNAFRNMLVSLAVSETPAVFSLVVALLLYFSAWNTETNQSIALAFAYVGAGISMGFGSLGSGLGSGMVGQKSMEVIARTPSSQSNVMVCMLIGQAWAQTGCIFAMVVSLSMMNLSGLDALPTAADYVPHIGRYLGAGISIGLGSLGPALSAAYFSAKSCEEIGRSQLSQQPMLRNLLFLGGAISQTTVIYALIISLSMIFAV